MLKWLKGFARPLTVFLKVAGICLFIWLLASALPPYTQRNNLQLVYWLSHFCTFASLFMSKALRIAAVSALAWGLISANRMSSFFIRTKPTRAEMHLSKSATRFMSAIFNVLVVVFTAGVILTELEYNVSTLVAGLGLGGLTVALAAKDSASNFFGGLIMVTERPFEIGDWITCNEIEGTIEDITLRSTKIRTATGSLTIVPNSILSNAPITNWGDVMKKRQANFKLQLEYNTPHHLVKEYIAAVKTMLETDPQILPDGILVCLSDLNSSGMQIQIVFYASKAGFSGFMQVKERVHFSLLSLAYNLGIRFAYPVQTVYLKDTSASGGNVSAAKTIPQEFKGDINSED